jgi:threonine/homoserine/homoserine lactone efflux protein
MRWPSKGWRGALLQPRVPEAALFAQSLLIGLSIAAPVGPIGLLVIQRTLQRGARVGLATGLGAAVADALYGAIGAFGVSWVIDALVGARVPLALGGGAFLLWLAWRTWHTPPADKAAQAGGGTGLLSCFAGTFVLTLSNPATIFSFIAVFGTLGARLQAGSPWTMVAGVLVGSALWWLLLSAAVARLRSRFDAHAQALVNRASALLLAGFALWQWAGLQAG